MLGGWVMIKPAYPQLDSSGGLPPAYSPVTPPVVAVTNFIFESDDNFILESDDNLIMES